MNMSRRRFLKGAALGTASMGALSAGLLSGCAPQNSTEGASGESNASAEKNTANDYPVLKQSSMDAPTESFEGDVVVLGCGPGGIACSTRLAEQGAKVLLVEKTDKIGGTGTVASGNCYISLNSKFQLDQGFEADIPAFYEEWLVAVHYHCDHGILSTYLCNCGETVDWLMDYGFDFEMREHPAVPGLQGFAYRISQPKKDSGVREKAYNAMVDKVKEAGGAFHTGCTGTTLILDDDGAVVGLRAERGSDTVDFMGKAVVIATGGYAANREMINEYCKVPLLGRDPVLNNGEGAQMSWAAGAKKPWNLGILCVDTRYPIDENYNTYDTGLRPLGTKSDVLQVDQLGKRFHSESAFWWVPTYGGANAVEYDQPWIFTIVDQKAMDDLAADNSNVTEDYLESMIGAGVLFKGDTVEELAAAAGWDPEVFANQFKDYNDLCKAGEDPIFFKPAEDLVEYGEGPYYAVRLAPTPFGTCGDLCVTTDMEVCGTEPGSVVKGLYAVGTETVGTMHNDYYWALGQTVGWAHTSGRLAGEAIAKSIL